MSQPMIKVETSAATSCCGFWSAIGQVMLVSRVRAAVHLPINSDGYLETLRGSGRNGF